VLVQRSPSLAALHRPLTLALNPADLMALGADGDGAHLVRATNHRGTVVAETNPDPGLPPGTARLAFNLPAGGAGQLIDSDAAWTEVIVEVVTVPEATIGKVVSPS